MAIKVKIIEKPTKPKLFNLKSYILFLDTTPFLWLDPIYPRFRLYNDFMKHKQAYNAYSTYNEMSSLNITLTYNKEQTTLEICLMILQNALVRKLRLGIFWYFFNPNDQNPESDLRKLLHLSIFIYMIKRHN